MDYVVGSSVKEEVDKKRRDREFRKERRGIVVKIKPKGYSNKRHSSKQLGYTIKQIFPSKG